MQDEPKRPRMKRLGPVDLTVAPLGGEWVVSRVGAARSCGTYPTQEEAVHAAQAMTRSKGGQVLVHEHDGGVSESYTLGRLAFEKISAVEGIRLGRDMKRDLRLATAEAPTPEAARRMLAEKYGKPAG